MENMQSKNFIEISEEQLIKIINSIMIGLNETERYSNLTPYVVMGITGVGKSTLVNYLLGYNLKKHNGEIISADPNLALPAKIGEPGSGESTTEWPVVYQGKLGSLADLPGFIDTEIYTQLARDLSMSAIVKRSAKIPGIIFMLSHSWVSETRGFKDLAKSMDILQRIFQNNVKEVLNHSAVFLVNHLKEGADKNEILINMNNNLKSLKKKLLKIDKKDPKAKKYQVAIEVLELILQNPEKIILSRPLDKGESRKEIYEGLSKLKQPIDQTKFNFEYVDKGSREIVSNIELSIKNKYIPLLKKYLLHVEDFNNLESDINRKNQELVDFNTEFCEILKHTNEEINKFSELELQINKEKLARDELNKEFGLIEMQKDTLSEIKAFNNDFHITNGRSSGELIIKNKKNILLFAEYYYSTHTILSVLTEAIDILKKEEQNIEAKLEEFFEKRQDEHSDSDSDDEFYSMFSERRELNKLLLISVKRIRINHSDRYVKRLDDKNIKDLFNTALNILSKEKEKVRKNIEGIQLNIDLKKNDKVKLMSVINRIQIKLNKTEGYKDNSLKLVNELQQNLYEILTLNIEIDRYKLLLRDSIHDFDLMEKKENELKTIQRRFSDDIDIFIECYDLHFSKKDNKFRPISFLFRNEQDISKSEINSNKKTNYIPRYKVVLKQFYKKQFYQLMVDEIPQNSAVVDKFLNKVFEILDCMVRDFKERKDISIFVKTEIFNKESLEYFYEEKMAENLISLFSTFNIAYGYEIKNKISELFSIKECYVYDFHFNRIFEYEKNRILTAKEMLKIKTEKQEENINHLTREIANIIMRIEKHQKSVHAKELSIKKGQEELSYNNLSKENLNEKINQLAKVLSDKLNYFDNIIILSKFVKFEPSVLNEFKELFNKIKPELLKRVRSNLQFLEKTVEEHEQKINKIKQSGLERDKEQINHLKNILNETRIKISELKGYSENSNRDKMTYTDSSFFKKPNDQTTYNKQSKEEFGYFKTI